MAEVHHVGEFFEATLKTTGHHTNLNKFILSRDFG